MRIADLAAETIERIKTVRYDRFVEKHEGPFTWEDEFQYGSPEFMEVEGRYVLLPVDENQRPNITFLRCIPSADGRTLTLFLKDTTWIKEESGWDSIFAGVVAICDRLPGEDFYVAIFYHEWYIIDFPNHTLTIDTFSP